MRADNSAPYPEGAYTGRFVVQKHRASRLHYDFRLEADAVLKSWAIPKGPSLDPKDKRLAVPVEDHGLGYYDFEGVIGAGYGAGEVLVWDLGRYHSLETPPAHAQTITRALGRGRLSFWLEGEKLKGGFTLLHVGPPEAGRWLLAKRPDSHARPGYDVLTAEPRSVLTGRAIEELGGGRV